MPPYAEYIKLLNVVVDDLLAMTPKALILQKKGWWRQWESNPLNPHPNIVDPSSDYRAFRLYCRLNRVSFGPR